MDLNSAIQKHAEWKTRFRKAISGQETMDAATIAKGNCCELGQWLHGDGKRQFSKLPAHGTCVQMHAAFHVEASKVAKAINDKKFAVAESMLDTSTPYGKASSSVATAILQLKKAAAL
jgi:methyl-accepting chemotaxis protein